MLKQKGEQLTVLVGKLMKSGWDDQRIADHLRNEYELDPDLFKKSEVKKSAASRSGKKEVSEKPAPVASS